MHWREIVIEIVLFHISRRRCLHLMSITCHARYVSLHSCYAEMFKHDAMLDDESTGDM